MLKSLAFAGAILCAPVAAHANYWEEQFGIHPQTSPSSPRSRAQRPSRVDHHRLSRGGGAALNGPRPHAWCGWYMGRLLGLLDRSLWLAANWAHVGAPTTARPGAVVVWPHHVGKIVAVQGNRILVHSGNDGHAVRTRWRTTRGVIAYRWV